MAARLTVPLLGALAVVLLAPLACARNTGSPQAAAASSGRPETGAPAPTVDALERAIEADRARLIELISERAVDDPGLRESPELVEIAERLPQLEEELRLLRENLAASKAETSSP
jgi:hypothetical protein